MWSGAKLHCELGPECRRRKDMQHHYLSSDLYVQGLSGNAQQRWGSGCGNEFGKESLEKICVSPWRCGPRASLPGLCAPCCVINYPQIVINTVHMHLGQPTNGQLTPQKSDCELTTSYQFLISPGMDPQKHFPFHFVFYFLTL